MTITFIKEERRQKILLIIFSIIILAVILILWQGFFKKKAPPPSPGPAITYPEIKINFELLKNPLLKEFLPFEDISPFSETSGRENPFLPY